MMDTMIHVVREPAINFSASQKYGDDELTRDVLLNQVADLIVHNRNEVVNLLNDKHVGLSVPQNASDKVLIKKLLDNAQSNEMLSKGLAFLMVQQMEMGESHAGGGDPISAVADTIKSISGNIANKQNQKLQKQQNQADITKMILSKRQDEAKGKSRTKLILLITAGAIVLIIGGIYAWKYFKTPAIAPTPMPTPMPVPVG